MTPDSRQLLRHFEPGDVLDYIPKHGNHCRQATAVVYEDGAVDTFWGVNRYSEGYLLGDQEIEGAELRFPLGDFRKLGEHWEHKREEWLTYAPADRQRIGSQHQYQSTYYVRIGAEPDLDTQIANAREALAEAEREVSSAQQRIQLRWEDLAKLEAGRV